VQLIWNSFFRKSCHYKIVARNDGRARETKNI